MPHKILLANPISCKSLQTDNVYFFEIIKFRILHRTTENCFNKTNIRTKFETKEKF